MSWTVVWVYFGFDECDCFRFVEEIDIKLDGCLGFFWVSWTRLLPSFDEIERFVGVLFGLMNPIWTRKSENKNEFSSQYPPGIVELRTKF